MALPIYSALLTSDSPDAIDLVNQLHAMVKLDASRIEPLMTKIVTERWEKKPEEEFNRESYPQCTPPWNNTWVEWKKNNVEMASIVRVITDEASRQKVIDRFRENNAELYPGKKLEDWKTIVITKGYVMNGHTVYHCGQFGYLIDGQGDVICEGMDERFRKEETLAYLFLVSEVPLFAFSLANCKNIRAVENKDFVKLPGYIRRKKHIKRFFNYHTLKIVPSNTKKHGIVASAEESKKALHLCRGHFARYTEQAPLFGKYVGLFWKSPHIRGSDAAGVVEKDYSL